jgi:hypothetical protein
MIMLAACSCLLWFKPSDEPSPAVRAAQTPPPLTRVTIDDPFWSPRLKQWRDVTLPDVLTNLEIDREWQPGDTVEVAFPLVPARVRAHPRVRDLAGQVALTRGPILYIFEGIDNGGTVEAIRLPADAPLRAIARPDSPDRLPALEARVGDRRLVAIPFFARANRAPTDFTVWVPEAGSK